MVPVWDAALCTQCNKCILICPHAAIRAKVYDKSLLQHAPAAFKSADPIGKEWDKTKEAYSIQVSTEDCTGCNLCFEYCPITSKTDPSHKAVNMQKKPECKKLRINMGTIRYLTSLNNIRLDHVQGGVPKSPFPCITGSNQCTGSDQC